MDCSGYLHKRLIQFSLAALFTGLSCIFAPALEPPTREQITRYRQDGSLARRIEEAKSLGNHLTASELSSRAAMICENLSRQGDGLQKIQLENFPAPPPARSGMPSLGRVRLLCLLIDFPDYPAGNSPEFIRSRLFGDGNTGTSQDFPYESLRNYYYRSSYGKLDLSGNVLGWYRYPGNRTGIEQSKANREQVIRNCLSFYDAQGHDFTQYDSDGNGTIDYLIVIWSGPHGDWSSFWWGYFTNYSDNTFLLDGKRLNSYSWQWEAYDYPGIFSPRVVIHETGHALGLPDYYDYDLTAGPAGGTGELDMMDANRGDHNAFSKFMLGWITPTITAAGTNSISLRSSSSFPDAHILMRGAAAGSLFSEFFLIQHRRRAGNDFPYPADGLLIWHVDARLNNTGRDFLYNNSTTEHKLLRLMEADGLEEIETGDGLADAGDYFTPGTSFGPASTPASTLYNSLPSSLGIREIIDQIDTIRFQTTDVSGDTTPPGGSLAPPLDEGELTASANVTFSWKPGSAQDPESGIAGYYLQAGTNPGGHDLFDGRVGKILTYTIKDIPHLTNCYARVAAVNGAGLTGAWSPSSDGITVALGFLSVSPSSSQLPAGGGTQTFVISNTGSYSFTYHASVTSGNEWLTIVSGADGTNSGVLVVDATANTECPRTGMIHIEANGAGNSPADLYIQQAGAKTSILHVTPDRLQLDQYSGTTNIRIENTGCGNLFYSAAILPPASWISIISGANGSATGSLRLSYQANTTNQNRTATLIVTAGTAAGSPASITINQAGQTLPPAPGLLLASAWSSSSIRLTWQDNSSNETGFQIQRRFTATEWHNIAKVPAGTVQYSDTGLLRDTPYYYRVFTIHPAGNSLPSNEAGAVTFSYDAIIPAAACTGGVGGTSWRSDLDLFNYGEYDASVTVALFDKNQANPNPATATILVPAGQTIRLENILGSIFNTTNAALAFRYGEAQVHINSRFYNISARCNGTFGMYIPASPCREAISRDRKELGVFHHLSHSPQLDKGFRTNIGFANPCSFNVTVLIRLYGDDGQQIGSTTQTIQAYEHRQFTWIHSSFNAPPVNRGWASVEVLTNGGRIHTYAMLIDNLSGDPVFMLPERYSTASVSSEAIPAAMKTLSPYQIFLPAAAHAGSSSFRWLTDVDILNMSEQPAAVEADILVFGRSNLNPETVSLTVPPKQCLRISDFLGTYSSVSNAALGFRFEPGSVFINGRFFNTGSTCSNGTYGMYIPPVAEPDALPGDGQSYGYFHYLSYSSDQRSGYRTNIGFANASGSPATVEIYLFDDEGLLAGTWIINLQPYEHQQLTKIHQLAGTPDIAHGFAVLQAVTPGSLVHIYAMLIDNLSNDPMYMPVTVISPGD